MVAADGVGSKSWSLVLGRKDAPISSGFACFRSTFPASVAMANPIIAKEMENFGDRISLHPGNGTHMVVAKTDRTICYILTHRVCASTVRMEGYLMVLLGRARFRRELGQNRARRSRFAVSRGWDPFLAEMIKVTPNNCSTDWRLMWRNPQPRWSSLHSRVVQLGDSAHSFLPTSGSGAAMAMEDAYSLASCLQLGGKSNLVLAVSVHNLLR